MASKVYTVFQNLDKAISGNWDSNNQKNHNNTYDLSSYKNDVIYKTKDKEDYARTKLELQQNRYLNNRWVKANTDLSVQAFAGLNNVKLMYRDADLMDSFPEIGAALDIISEECSVLSSKGQIVNVYSKSDRIKSVLEELFTNRLDLQITAPMIIRAMCKYGNQFMLLNIDNKLGITGWRQLPVFNVERLENGVENQFAINGSHSNVDNKNDMSTKFVWQDENNTQVPFRNWQIGHFRLLTDSLYLPYGVSYLNKARRHWRMLSLMEDMMLIYRLDRSIERRVYKIYVGAIDDADVKAYVEDIANNFKRTPIIDPLTGQVDLRKNLLPVWKKTPIPLLDGRTITIEELSKEFEEGKENYVYSIQDKTLNVVPGKVVWCGKNYTANKMIKLTLDDDSYMVMAGEHEIVMRDGSKKRADECVIGESIMPFYVKKDKNSKKLFDKYEKIYNPHSGKFEFTHRLIANNINKENDAYNTVHHIDFNKYNNSPKNLLWCDYHEHHKMHSELAKQMWLDDDKRNRIIGKLSDLAKKRYELNEFSDETKTKISKTLKHKYASGELDYVKEKSSKTMSDYNKLPSSIEERKIRGKSLGYNKYFKEYNESELHKQHNEIRREASRNSWVGKGRTERIEKMKIHFDEFIWEKLRDSIISKEIYNRKTMIDYINTNLISHLILINNNNRLNKNKFISREVLENRIKERGFSTITEFINEQKKNHKITNIEWIDGDDVYCMTVVGPNNEDDRHNFALRTFNEDLSWNENGCFVSNCVDQDIFIPVRDPNAPTPIDTLSAAQNLTAMDDIKFVQNKVLTALRIPKSFLNFEETTGDGKNLALMDIRFTRTVNRIQQAFLMELTKIASIHLYILGFTDELTNFSLSMNNPSTQAEQLEIDNIQKKITAIRDAVSDPGNGIPIMSQTRALKEIMKWSDKDIQNNFEEIRLEKAISAELEKTSQIIKKTGIFDTVDRIYGEPGAEYQENQEPQGEEGMPPAGGGGGGFAGGDLGGGDMDMGDENADADIDNLGNIGDDESTDINGTEGEIPISDNQQAAPKTESRKRKKTKKLINENKLDKFFLERFNKRNETVVERVDVLDKTLLINDEFNGMINSLNEIKK